ncbi:unnamed protein product [Brassica oleracea]
MNGIQVLKKVKEKIKKINNVLTKHRHGHGHEHDRGEQHIPDDHDLDDKDAEEYDVGQIYQQGHGGAPGMSIPYLTSLSLPVTFWYLRFIGFVSRKSFSCHGNFPH